MKHKRYKKLLKILIIPIAVGISLSFHFSFAQSPREINISAYLVNGENKELPNGEYEIRFALYGSDRSTADPYPSNSDARAWEEVQKIKIEDGFLNAYLGAVTSIPDNIDFTKNSYYLGIRIGTDGEMFPRKRIGAVPLAVDSFSVQGSVPGNAAGNLVLLGANGKVDIKQLPTGTKANASTLVLGNDKRLVQEELSVSGSYDYLSVSDHEITLSQINLSSDVTGLLDVSNLTGVLDIPNGGTGISSFAKGDMMYYNSGNSLSNLGIGNSGQILTVSGGLPVWADAALNIYTASGTLLQLSGNDFFLKEGELSNGKLCFYSSADGLVCNIEPGVGGAAYTAGSGLTLNVAEFKLGGTLSEFTSIDLNYNNFVFSGTGNVGIGTTDPTRSLDINGAIHVAAVSVPGSPVAGDIYSDGTNIYFYNGLGWDDLTDTGAGTSQWDDVAGGINYASGKVGIGTTNLTAYLEIKAGTNAVGTAPIKFTAGTNLDTPENGAMEFNGSHLYITAGGIRYQLDQQSLSSYTAGNGLTLDGSEFDLGGTLSEFTSIDLNYNNFVFSGTGNVGIGTTDPVGMFDVNGKLTVLSGGNIGVGTVNSTRIIGIGGDENRNIGMERGTAVETAGYNLTINAGGATLGSSDANGGNLYLSSGVSTGKGSSNIYFQTSPVAVSGKIKTIASAPTFGGSGYSADDTLTVSSDGTGGQVRVATVDESGKVLTLETTPVAAGSGYVVGTGKSTTGGGSGCKISITEITETSDNALSASVAILGSGKVGFGITNPQSALHIFSTSEQLRLSYNSSNYFSFLTDFAGDLSLTPSGGTGGLRIIGVDSDEPIIIGGMTNNTATGPGAFIGNGTGNGITGTESFIGSGNWNVVSGKYSFIGAGSSNTVSGDQSYVGGGNSNVVSGTYSYIGGGWQNEVSGWSSAIFGGYKNIVSGSYAAVIGGLENLAGANYTVTAGRQARTTNQGTFVFSDSQNAQFNINVNDTFGMRFAGGYWLTGGNVGIGTTNPLQKLSVSGDASFTGDVYGQSGIYGIPGTDTAGISNAWLGAKWTTTSQIGLSIKGPGSQAANYLEVSSSTGTGNVFVVDSSGRVGIGVTNPTAKINLAAGGTGSGTAPLKFTSGSLLNSFENGAMEYDGSHLYFTVGSYRAQIDQQAGTVYTEGNDINIIGSQIDVESQLDYVSVINQTSADLTLKTTTSGNIILNPMGNVGVGITNPSYKFDVATSTANDRGINIAHTAVTGTNYGIYSSVTGTATANYAGYFTAGGASNNYGLYVNAGDIYTPLGDGTVTVASHVLTTSSDERLKNITGEFSRGLDEIMGINPILYKWNKTSGLGMSPLYAGFSAQNIQSVVPEAVSMDSRGFLSLSDRPILAAVVNAIQTQQSQITSLDSLTANRNSQISGINSQFTVLGSKYSELFAKNQELNLDISEKYSILTGQIDTLQQRIEEDPYQMQISGLESKITTLEEKLIALENPQSTITTSEEKRDVSFQSFTEDTDLTNINTNLTNIALEIGSFGGNYETPDTYNEIRIVNEGVNIYSSSLVSEYLELPIYIEDASSITDIVAELGNQMDSNEIQWNKDQFQNLTNGWNTIKLDLSKGFKTGDIDWTHLNYLRVYFNSSNINKIKIGNIKIEITETVTRVASAGNSDDISLSSQLTVFSSQYSELLTKNQELVSQMADIKAQNDANSKLLLAMDPKTMVYKDEMGSVDLLKGKLEAGGIVAGAFTVKNVDDSPKTIGEAIIEKVEKDEDNDGIDDVKVDANGEKTIDGKNVPVKTKAVSETAKIFTSFESNPNAHSWVDKIKDGNGNYIGFKIMIDSATDKNVKVNWWIVESK